MAQPAVGYGAPPLALPPPPIGAYTGAYVDFGETEDHVTLAAIEGFEKLVGKHQAIVASSSFWGRGGFPGGNVRAISEHGSVPLLYWSPWGPPYEQGQHVARDPWSLPRIVAGECDAYLDKWAAGAKEYGRPMFVSFGCEPNSDWFPWCGQDNGGATAGPELYKRACRHVIDRVRAAGVTNIAWVFQANNTSIPEEAWNGMGEYYPGADYVDWLGMSVYGQITPGKDSWDTWSEAMDAAYKQLCALDPQKPVMLAEWGVGEFPNSGDKPGFIREALTGLEGGKYPRVKAAVFWHERWQNKDETWSNLRVNSSPGALKAYREGVGKGFWLEHAVEAVR